MILKRYRFGDAFSKISLFTIKQKKLDRMELVLCP